MSNHTEWYGKPQIHMPPASLGSSLFTSPPFKFIVDGTPVYIHASLVAQHSRPLERMINGSMVEAKQGFAVLKEVDESTLIRFAHWAYKGYYPAAEPEYRPSDHKDATPDEKRGSMKRPIPEWARDISPTVVDGQDIFVSRYLSKKKGKKGYETLSAPLIRSTRKDLKEAFINRKSTNRQSCINIPPPRANKHSAEDYTGVFLCHARLYVFADQYDVQPLKALALEELQLTLANYTLYSERTGDIIALLRYSYANTCEPTAGVEDLRTMLTAYMSYEVDTLMKDKAFQDLMVVDGGALLGDFIKIMEKRIPADDLVATGSDWM